MVRGLLPVPLRSIVRAVAAFAVANMMMTTALLAQTVAPANDINGIKGSLFIMGGAVRPDNSELWNRLIAAAGGRGAKFAVIAAAAGNPESSALRIIEALRAHGADGVLIPVAPGLPKTDYRKAAQDSEIARTVAESSGVFFTGGDQSRITDALLMPDGKPTAVLDAVWSVYRRGGVIAGTSAGAAVMSTTMFFEPPDVLSLLKSGVVKGRDIAPGLGFVGSGVFVDQHVLARGRFARMVPAMRAAGYTFGVGVDENTALFVDASGTAEVVGSSGVVIVDTSHTRVARLDDEIEVSGVRLSYLERGDRVNFQSRTVKPSAFKLAGRMLDHKALDFKPEFDEPRFYADVLAKNQLIEILCNLADNKVLKVTGLAFGSPESKSPAAAFEYTFRKGSATLAYLRIENTTAHYTVLNVEMDIRRVAMSVPLYRKR